ncbi:MAG: hypothetical protein ACLVJO_01335 [[Clostridium] scindens]
MISTLMDAYLSNLRLINEEWLLEIASTAILAILIIANIVAAWRSKAIEEGGDMTTRGLYAR